VRINRSNSEIWPDRIYIHDGDEEFNQYLQNYDERTYSEIDDFTIFAIVQEKYAGRPKRSRQEYRKMLEAAVKSTIVVLPKLYTLIYPVTKSTTARIL
jgi:hypothetical protein